MFKNCASNVGENYSKDLECCKYTFVFSAVHRAMTEQLFLRYLFNVFLGFLIKNIINLYTILNLHLIVWLFDIY